MQPTATAATPRPAPAGERAVAAGEGRWGGWLAAAGAALAVAAGVALRLWSRSDLWLDEALSVNIAALPLGDLVDALRRDGHPPLYYLLLHGWIEVFGDGDVATRSLSAVFGIAALPLAWTAGRRYGGRGVAAAALLLLATSPFAIRYATEARMYSLATFLVVAGWLALRRAAERPAATRLAVVAVVGGLLLLTHYWAFYLLAAVLGVLAWRWWHRPASRPVLGRLAVGVAASGILFLPWLPAFLDQAGSTGTPWGRPERPANVVAVTLTDFGGGAYGEAQLLGASLAVLALLAVFGRALDRDRVELDLRSRPATRPEAVVVAGTLGLAVLAGYATGSAFASRYAAVVLPLVVLLAARGTTLLLRPGARRAVLAVLVVLGLAGGVRTMLTQRTQAGEVADYIVEHGSPGDVVAFCPDQLGPAVTRLLPGGFEGTTFPEGGDPRFVDWVDYADRMTAGDPVEYAAELHRRAGRATVWLVWAAEYRTLDERCEEVGDALQELRAGVPVVESGDEFEHAWLFQYGAAPE